MVGTRRRWRTVCYKDLGHLRRKTLLARPENKNRLRRFVIACTALALRKRIELTLALPLERLDRLAMQRQVKDIGAR
jgi:hypothetical protein